MSFFSRKTKKLPNHGVKLPPMGAWEHYSKKQGYKSFSKFADIRGKRLIEVTSLTLAYDGKTVIEDLSFTVRSGDYISIVGENGSGKSTLMSALLGLITPREGSVFFENVEKREIGFLPQISDIQSDFPATVGEVVLSGCISRFKKSPILPKEAKRLAFSNMEKLGITSLKDHPFNKLSGGQKQRALIARALCSAEKMLILDEPTTALDLSATADLYSLIHDLNLAGMTVISVTHDIAAAMKYSNKILYVSKNSAKIFTVEEFQKTPFAEAISKNTDDKKTPYGDGGFRYRGEDI